MSFDPFSLFAAGPAPLMEGSVSRAVSDAADGVFATATQPLGVEFGPMPWPYGDSHLPTVGDRILIAQPAHGNPWIVSWDPHS